MQRASRKKAERAELDSSIERYKELYQQLLKLQTMAGVLKVFEVGSRYLDQCREYRLRKNKEDLQTMKINWMKRFDPGDTPTSGHQSQFPQKDGTPQ
jgi:hypothetical protein